MSRATHPLGRVLDARPVKTTAVLLAAVTLSCAAGVGASSASAAGAPTPTTPPSAPTSGGVAAGATPVGVPVPASASGTPRVPKVVPDAPARVRAKVTRFALSATTWAAGAAQPTIVLRLDATRATAARVQVRVEDRVTRRIVLRQSLGTVRSGVDVTSRVTKRLAGLPGRYRLQLIVRDQTGHRTKQAQGLRVGAPVPKPVPKRPAPAAPAPVVGYVFPVQGPCNFRSVDAQRFQAGRGGGRAHNGHDIGTFAGFPPVVAITASTISSVAYDGGGGGWTIVMNGDDGVAYGYLHLRAGTIVVHPGQRVAAGQRVGDAGNSGGDYEPHLHFEMRPIPWSAHRADAIDPLPLLSRLPNPCEG